MFTTYLTVYITFQQPISAPTYCSTTYLTAYITYPSPILTLPYSLTPSFIQESHFLKIVGTHLDSVQQNAGK